MFLVLLRLEFLTFFVLLLSQLVLLLLIFLVQLWVACVRSGTAFPRRKIVRMHYRSSSATFCAASRIGSPRVCAARFSASHHAIALKISGPGGRNNFRAAVVDRCALVLVCARSFYMLSLRGYRPDVSLMRRSLFFPRWTRIDSAVSVKAHVRIVPYVDVLVVNVVKAFSHVPHCCVVEEMPAFPTSTDEAGAEVAESVINPAIETDRRSPKSRGENKRAIVPAPPRRSPQEAHFRRKYPRAGHPIVVGNIVVIIPVPGRPYITVAGTNRLFVHRQHRRRYRNRYADLCHRRARHRQHSYQ